LAIRRAEPRKGRGDKARILSFPPLAGVIWELYIGASLETRQMHQDRVNKLRYRAWRRGFLEADLVLGPFADESLHAFSADELDAFEQLLEQPDPDLYAWITEQADPPATLDTPVLARIRTFRHAAKAARDLKTAREL
jgi:antitoxin CptB